MCEILGPAIVDTGAICVPHAYTPARVAKEWICDVDFDLRMALSWNDTFIRLGYEGIQFVVGEMGPIGALGWPQPLGVEDGWRSSACIDGDEARMIRMLFDLQSCCWEYNDSVGYEAIVALCPFTSGIGIGWDRFLLWGEQWRHIREAYERAGIA